MRIGRRELSEPPFFDLTRVQRDLSTGRFGKTLHYFNEIDSTNTFAFKRAQAGAQEGEIVLAESQTKGKGRLGRSWLSPPGVNLYLSMVLRPTFSPSNAPQITLAAAVALAETVESFITAAPEIKWPNDILIGGKKAAGILTEASFDKSRLLFVILGLGVNLNLPEDSIPSELRDRATSLFLATGHPVAREAFLVRLIQNLERCYGVLETQGFETLKKRWESYFRLQGRRVKVQMTDHSLSGRVAGVDGEGALLVEAAGEVERVYAGDIFPLED